MTTLNWILIGIIIVLVITLVFVLVSFRKVGELLGGSIEAVIKGLWG